MPIINDILVTFVFCLQFEHRIPGCTIEFVCFVFKLCKDCNYISRLQTILCKDCDYISGWQTILCKVCTYISRWQTILRKVCNYISRLQTILCKVCNYISRCQTILCKVCDYISRLQTILNLLLPFSGLLPCLRTEAINSPTGYQIKETFIIVFLGGTWGDVGGMGHASHLAQIYGSSALEVFSGLVISQLMFAGVEDEPSLFPSLQ